MNDTPSIAAVICACNPPRIWETLAARLAGHPFEQVLVIDDGSTVPIELPAALRASQRVRVVRIPINAGLAAARNTAIEMLASDWILFVDSDVLPSTTFLEELPDLLKNAPEDGLGFHVREHHRRSDWDSYRGCERDLMKPCNPVEWLSGLLTAYRRPALMAVGGFDTAFRTNGEDVDLGFRLTRSGFTLRFIDRCSGEHYRKDTLSSFVRMHHRYAATAKHVDRGRYFRAKETSTAALPPLFYWRSLVPLLALMARFVLMRPWALYVPVLVILAMLKGACDGRRMMQQEGVVLLPVPNRVN